MQTLNFDKKKINLSWNEIALRAWPNSPTTIHRGSAISFPLL